VVVDDGNKYEHNRRENICFIVITNKTGQHLHLMCIALQVNSSAR
jgi:hypothetical protein